MAKKTKDSNLSLEERLEQALIPNWDEPYKLPQNWCWVNLGSLGTLGMGQTILSKDLKQEGVPVYSATEEDKIFGYILESENTIKLSSGDIVIPARGNSIGYVKYVSCDEASCTQTTMFFKPFDKTIGKCVYYYMQGNKHKLFAYHGNAIPQITITNITKKEIPIPPLNEQHRIVERIESLFAQLDEAKEKAQEVVDGFETRKAAILHKAFSGELTAKWREANGIKSNNWELIKLQDVCEKIVCGKTPTEYIAEHGEVPFLKVYNIVDNQIDFETTPQFIPKSIHHGKLKSSGLKPNDVIMNIVGPPLRKIAIIPDTYPEWNMNQAIVRFRPTEALNHKFLYYALINPETLDEVIAATRGVVGQANISVSQSRSLTINMPSWDEQIEVVRILDCIIGKEIYAKDSATAVIEQIDTMKKAILARAFRGELGTNDPSEESAVELLKRVLSGGEN